MTSADILLVARVAAVFRECTLSPVAVGLMVRSRALTRQAR